MQAFVARGNGVDVKNQIVALTHIDKNVYCATKSRMLCKYEVAQIQGQAIGSVANTSASENIVKLDNMIWEDERILIYQGANHMFYWREPDFGKKTPVMIQEVKSVKCFTVIPNSPYMVVVDPAVIHVYIFKNGVFVHHKDTQHAMRGVLDIHGSRNRFFMYDKKELICGDLELKRFEKQPLAKPFKLCTIADGNNTFIAVGQDNQINQMGEKVISPNITLPEDMIALHVRVPYIYAMTQRQMFVYSSSGEKAITETLTLPIRKKNSLMSIIDDYSVVYAAENSLFSYRYTGATCHIDRLKKEDRWEAAILLCISMRSPKFDRNATLAQLYDSQCENYFRKGRFAESFTAFRKSGKHPFEMIRRFRKYLSAENFGEIAKRDVNDYIDVLEELCRLLDANEPTENILKQMEVIKKQTNSKKPLPDASYIIHNKELLAQECRNDLKEAHDVHQQIENLFQTPGVTNVSGDHHSSITELSNLIEETLKHESHPTRIKIYNTILVQCYCATRPMQLELFMKEDPPLFFNVAAIALKASNLSIIFLDLCEKYHNHNEAITYLYEQSKDGNYDSLIRYVNSSADYIKLAPEQFKRLYDNFKEKMEKGHDKGDTSMQAGERAIRVFFSMNLTYDDIKKVLPIIDKMLDVPKETRAVMEIKFLEFAIFVRGIECVSIHTKLISIYLDILKDDSRLREGNRKYIRIEDEKSPQLRSLRTGLMKLLEMSNSYQPLEIIPKISQCFLEEKLAAMRKAGRIDQCIELVSQNSVPFSVALDFCDKVYDEDDPEKSDVYNALFFQLNKMRNTNDNVNLKLLLNQRAERLDPVRVVENIPKNIPLAELKDYLKLSSLARINRLRSLKIRNALLAKTVAAKRQQLRYLQSGRVEVKDNLKCVVCGKPIGDAVFYVLADNCVSHAFHQK